MMNILITKSSDLMMIILYVAAVVLMCGCEALRNGSSIVGGFTTDLIHRDSPESPLYDPSSTYSQRLASAMERSLSRSERLNESLTSNSKTVESVITGGSGEYLMSFSIGTPPVPTIGFADTGSSVVWTQCKPCIKCFPQRLPIFNPSLSSTFKYVGCKDTYNCESLSPFSSCGGQYCEYSLSYLDTSHSHGVVALDTFTFTSTGRKMQYIPEMVFGCGHDNFNNIRGTASGIVGLGGGRGSLVKQLAYDKFSYCLVPYGDRNKGTKVNFGVNAEVSGEGVVRMALIQRNPPEHYYLTLKGISVGNTRLEYHNPFLVDGVGNIIIDSGSTLTLLPVNFYNDLVNALRRAIWLPPLRSINFDLCYYKRGKNIVTPKVTVHFKEADVEWKNDNLFVRTSDRYVCFAARPFQGMPIYGNIAQANFLVGYDFAKSTVSFKPTNHCGI